MLIRRGAAEDVTAIDRIQQGEPLWPAREYLAHELWVAEHEGLVAGFVALRTVDLGEREILSMAVDPRYRRRRIGEALLRRVLAAAGGQVFLEVRVSNLAARALYAKVGFTAVGRRKAYYAQPVEDALVLRVVTRDPEC